MTAPRKTQAAAHSVRLLTMLVGCAFVMGAAFAATPAPEQWAPGRLLVQGKPGLSDTDLDQILKGHGAKRIGKIEDIDVHVVQLPAGASEKAVAALLAKNPHLKFAERDMRVKHAGTVNDPSFSSQWHLTKIGAPTAWDTATGQGVTIAILDTGVDGTHPDLVPQLVPGWNFYDNNSNTSDVYGHGTAVAGTAAAAGNNGIGVASVAYGAKIMPVRIADPSGYAYYSTIASGLTWAADNGAKVANISFEGVAASSAIQSAAQYLKGKGGLTVVAAGNSGTNPGYPATSTMIPVSATDSTDTLTSWSSYGSYVDISAPGTPILTTNNGSGYGQWQGTSFSSPIVAGAVADMMAANPALDPATVQNLLLSTAHDLGTAGYDIYYGYGRVDAAAAVQAAKGAVQTDTTAPTVSISSPSSGSTVKGLVAINVGASDNVGVSHVDLVVNGSPFASDATSPYGFSWDSTKVSDGNVTLTAYAYDAAGNYSSSTVTVKVSNTVDTTPPTARITSPANGGSVSGTVGITASATDNIGVTGFSLYIDGQLKTTVTTGSLSYNWNVRKAAAGTHTITVKALDAAGNTGSQTIQVVK